MHVHRYHRRLMHNTSGIETNLHLSLWDLFLIRLLRFKRNKIPSPIFGCMTGNRTPVMNVNPPSVLENTEQKTVPLLHAYRCIWIALSPEHQSSRHLRLSMGHLPAARFSIGQMMEAGSIMLLTSDILLDCFLSRVVSPPRNPVHFPTPSVKVR